ncbi:hypothetical protein Bbelb_121200 [Branchiostoma belcheri]|nr:hypothetical protein Bbelb_121200 [Branchiostoma belcheri]
MDLGLGCLFWPVTRRTNWRIFCLFCSAHVRWGREGAPPMVDPLPLANQKPFRRVGHGSGHIQNRARAWIQKHGSGYSLRIQERRFAPGTVLDTCGLSRTVPELGYKSMVLDPPALRLSLRRVSTFVRSSALQTACPLEAGVGVFDPRANMFAETSRRRKNPCVARQPLDAKTAGCEPGTGLFTAGPADVTMVTASVRRLRLQRLHHL